MKVLLAFLLLASIAQAQSPAPQVTINWGTTGVSGYNVYRFKGICPTVPSLATFTKIAVITTLSWTYSYVDTAVTRGTTYCYIVTAFTSSQESGWTGAWQATIPAFTTTAATQSIRRRK